MTDQTDLEDNLPITRAELTEALHMMRSYTLQAIIVGAYGATGQAEQLKEAGEALQKMDDDMVRRFGAYKPANSNG